MIIIIMIIIIIFPNSFTHLYPKQIILRQIYFTYMSGIATPDQGSLGVITTISYSPLRTVASPLDAIQCHTHEISFCGGFYSYSRPRRFLY